MKSFIKNLSLFAVMAIISFSCGEDTDEDTPPKLSNLVAETHAGSTTVKRGEAFGVEFDAESMNDGKLEKYHIEIHDHPASGLVEDEYRIIDSTFADQVTFAGTKNAHVHEHITVPINANLGKYHVVVVVFDEFGNTVDTENGDTEIEVVE